MTSAIHAVPDSKALSVQGEQQRKITTDYYASIEDVQRYVDTAPEDHLPCRQNFRHNYPALPRRNWVPDLITPRGRLIRLTEPCRDCKLVRQVQVFRPVYKGKGRKREVVGVQWDRSYPDYLEGPNGETYRVQGFGMMRPRDIRSIIASGAIDNEEGAAMLAAAAEAEQEWLAKHPEATA